MSALNTYNEYGEVCVYCHTPHNARTDAGAPLWNRADPETNYTLYSSDSLRSQPGQPGPKSMVCLSCHDGTISVDAVINAPQGTEWESWQNSATGTVPFHGRLQGPEGVDFEGWRALPDNRSVACQAFFYLGFRLLFFFRGRVLPRVPRKILPRLVLRSPLPMVGIVASLAGRANLVSVIPAGKTLVRI